MLDSMCNAFPPHPADQLVPMPMATTSGWLYLARPSHIRFASTHFLLLSLCDVISVRREFGNGGAGSADAAAKERVGLVAVT